MSIEDNLNERLASKKNIDYAAISKNNKEINELRSVKGYMNRQKNIDNFTKFKFSDKFNMIVFNREVWAYSNDNVEYEKFIARLAILYNIFATDAYRGIVIIFSFIVAMIICIIFNMCTEYSGPMTWATSIFLATSSCFLTIICSCAYIDLKYKNKNLDEPYYYKESLDSHSGFVTLDENSIDCRLKELKS